VIKMAFFRKDINLNKLAKEITEEEGMKEELSIAQVKEVMKILLTKMADMDIIELANILKRYKK
jgi:hypothetical protein